MAEVQFLSDLHLAAGRPEVTRRFLHYLESRGRDADAVYILGDLFEAWIGDDDDSTLSRDVIHGLKGCADAGTRIFILRGNRDFLLGERFSLSSGCTLLDDPVRIELFGQPVLLMHGDTLCSEDTDYLVMRSRFRNPAWQRDFLARSLAERRRIAAGFRDASRAAGLSRTGESTDVSLEAVIRNMCDYGVRLLIHGHTHRQARHPLAIGRETATRISLGSWESGGHYLECTPGDCRFRYYSESR